MHRLTALLFAALFAGAAMAAPQMAAADTGKLTGGMAHQYPDWFKESFLDLKEDAAEAADENKHVILFLALNGCPYCARMVKESFAENKEAMLKDFDSIGINIRGDRTVSLDGENEMTEKQIARQLRIRFTPTILFLDGEAETVFRIDGYWNPAQFRIALDYVSSGSYRDMKIAEFAKRREAAAVWNFPRHPAMSDVSDLSKVDGPLLLLFEDAACTACRELHDELLSRADVTEALRAYTFVRLDARSDAPLTGPDGAATTAQALAETLGVRASPTFAAFAEGELRQRYDAKLYSHHFISVLEYVSGKHYKTHETWLSYNRTRTARILEAGKDIDLSDGRTKKAE